MTNTNTLLPYPYDQENDVVKIDRPYLIEVRVSRYDDEAKVWRIVKKLLPSPPEDEELPPWRPFSKMRMPADGMIDPNVWTPPPGWK